MIISLSMQCEACSWAYKKLYISMFDVIGYYYVFEHGVLNVFMIDWSWINGPKYKGYIF